MIIVFFLVGIVMGSFVNMLTWRMHNEESILGRSYCDKTRKQLQPIDLIPIFSFILHKGKCRECGEKLPWIYPVTEFTFGLVGAFVYSQVDAFAMSYSELFINVFIGLVLSYIMLYFAVYDYHYWSVEVRSVVASFIVIFTLMLVSTFLYTTPLLPKFISSIYGALAGAGFIGFVVFITKGGGMGSGDIFLFGLAGLIVGIEGLWWTFMITVTTGALIGIVIWILKKNIKGVRIQFAPLIALGTIIVFLYKDPILELVSNYIYF